MITNFKIYSTKLNISENRIFENKFTRFENKSFYIINGNQSIVVKTLEHLISIPYKKNYNLQSILDALKLKGFKYKGVFIFKRPNSINLSFYAFKNDAEKNKIMKNELNYRGEIKLENDEIVLDTLEPDMKKYNL